MNKLFIGIDSGSTMCKLVLFDGAKVLDKCIVKAGWNVGQSAQEAYNTILKNRDLNPDDVVVASTGYGREIISFADFSLTEIKSHAYGGLFISPDIQGIIDIGGQDSKVIKLERGMITNFVMNDKCAAGTGRFLDMACDTLGIPLDEIDNFANFRESISINSMCTVFAESEIISLLSCQEDRSRILAGVLDSIARKVCQLAGKLNDLRDAPWLFTGGLARSKVLANMIEKMMEEKIITHPLSPFAGALGACICAYKGNV